MKPSTEKLVTKMTAKKRDKLPATSFGLPGQRKYPVNDRKHAILAKAYATKEVERGNLTPAQQAQIDAKANKKLKQGD
jgi:hypothetical protein